MTFSDFAKMLYTYLGGESKTSDFVLALTDAILEESNDNSDLSELNPLVSGKSGKAYKVGSLEKVYNGGLKIAQAKASAMVKRLYSENFSEYVNKLSPDALSLLSEDLSKRGIDVSGGNIGDVCAELFKSIIKELADGKSSATTFTKLSEPMKYEFGADIAPSLISSDLNLLMESNRKCPLCRTKSLVTDKGNNSLPQYKIVDILPIAPTDKEKEIYGDLLASPINRASSENKIPLCLECANSYTTLPTKEDCLKLLELKKSLHKNYLAQQMTDEMYLESEIEAVLRGIANATSSELKDKLDYSALKIDRKITDMALMSKAEGFAMKYYQYIKGLFAQLERELNLDFEDIAGSVKATYKRLNKQNLTQEEIFTHLTVWFQDKSKSNNIAACETIVSFFIQNCEVYDEIAE